MVTVNKEKEKYLVFVDHRFSRMAEKQLRAALPGCKLEPYQVINGDKFNTAFFRVEAAGDVAAKIRDAASSFVDFVMPVDAVLAGGIFIADYQKIEEAISTVLDSNKQRSFKLEVKRIDLVADETAKSIEVRLGSELEKRGYRANLTMPELMVYVVLLEDSTVIGHTDTRDQKEYVLDIFRRDNREHGDQLNRAEFKIEEAVTFFNIDLAKHKLALDIGASPGGWTRYLSQHGIKMVAVDHALLNYKQIGEGKKVLVLTDDADMPAIQKLIDSQGLAKNISVADINRPSLRLRDYDIVHIKANMEQDKRIELLRGFGRFDILTIDTNTSPLESSTIANSLAELLDRDATLIMTVKLTTRAFTEHVATAEAELSKKYVSIQLKKLPHNRRELTAYGILNPSEREIPHPSGVG